jgi:hypothetical protein
MFFEMPSKTEGGLQKKLELEIDRNMKNFDKTVLASDLF